MRPPVTLLLLARLRAALIDPARRERSMLAALAAYTVLWTAYATIAKSSQGLHPDMTELIAWSRDLAWGFKHPPLAAALVWLWFSVFPLAEWSYYLLAMLMPALALWIVWRLAADYLDGEKRVVGVALLMLVPFFNFHAIKYNVNTVLLPLWAAATLAFLRSYRTRRVGWAVLAGALAAACMLGKYWSVFLLAGLVLAALIDQRRGRYFRSPAPWITMAVGFAVLAPHLVWLAQHHFAPFAYAAAIHADKPFGASLIRSFGYLAGSLGYVAAPLIIVAIVGWRSGISVADMIWPAELERRLAAATFWAPLFLPAVVAPLAGVEISSLWSMSCWTLLPVLLLSPPALAVRAVDTCRILGLALALPLVMLVASPAIAILAQRAGPLPASAQASILTREVEREWNAATMHPLRFVGGTADLADGVATYVADAPRALPGLPPPDVGVLKRDGLVLVCLAEDSECRRQAAAKAASVGPNRSSIIEITRNFMSFRGTPQRYTIWIVPPQR
jgi:4-amino-4-deoxy-L-arabinose transferase-like glycosyltransferase